MMQELTLPEIATSDRHSMKRGPFGGALKKDIFVDEGYVVYEQQHAIYKRFNDFRYYIDESKYKELMAFKVEEGDLIISCSGTIGKIAEVPKGFKPGIINQALLKLTLDQSKVLNKYFIYLFEGEKIQSQLFNLSHGTGLKNFPPMSVVKSIKFPLPPLDQQKKIAAILDAADVYRQKTKALITKYEELTQSLFLDTFGDPVVNPNGWEKRKVIDLVNPKRPVTYGILMPKENIKPLGVPYIKVMDVKDGKILNEQVCHTSEEIESKYMRSRLKENDILISIRGHVGRVCIVPQRYIDANITQDTARLDFINNLTPEFAESCLKSIEFQRYISKYVKGAGVKGINLGDLKTLMILVPDMECQKKYSKLIINIKLQKRQAQASLAQAEDLFNSLLKRAFKEELI